ncbi:hypothetical protein IIV25_162R [Invertebrate iridovirus 25]|uniref:Uncharacterized protein n=1 Tax=Invertebrate iridovirus 25 TaxID=1301280 RepID=W8W2G8_9VIRU|nr:hypothetical protein IIV25_162R [Invertebrate iridovirus 25]CCV02180.1 hypothetical protein IIV25_162R [Invertebrate iridovirus 25]
MALIMEIMKTIAQPIGELAVWLEETYQVDVDETIKKWYELTGMKITVKEGEVSHEQVQSLNVDSTSEKKSNKKIPKTKDVCQHIFLSGQKVGEQCTTKPKGGATYCSAHRPKDSVKSSTSKKGKKKEVKKVVEKINSEFESDSEVEAPVAPKKEVKPKKVVKKPKKTSGDTDMEEDSDGELVPKEFLLKKKKQQQLAAAEIDSDAEALSEPETPVKPLLKKLKNVKAKAVKKPLKGYNTDDEIIDDDLDLSDN